MMSYALRSLAGAWDMMNGRPAGLDKLDLTIEGFWRSFAVIIPVIPLDLVFLAGDRAVMAAEGRAVPPLGLEEYALHLLAMVLSLLAALAVFALLAHPLRLTERFIPLIVAGNWSSLILLAILAVPYLLFLTGVLSVALFDWSVIGVGIVALASLYLVVRTALAVRPFFAIAVLLLALLIEVPIASSLDPTW